MARQQIPIDVKTPDNKPIPNASVTIRYDGDNTTLVPVYDGQNGPERISNPQRSDRYGRIAGWLDPGDYTAHVVAAGFRPFAFDFRIVSSEFEGPPGPVGPAGPPGPGLDGPTTYVHYQITPSNSWTVVHGLGKYPAVDVIDSAGSRVDGYEVVYSDSNSLIIDTGVPFSGRAICN